MEIKTNNFGYVDFTTRNFSYSGDKYTFARIKDGILIIKRATKGIVSSEYNAELIEFCNLFGKDFNALTCGSSFKIVLNPNIHKFDQKFA